jgi:hypothetical protein
MSLHDNRAEGEPDVPADTEMDFDKDDAEVEEICKPIDKHLKELADLIWKRHRKFLIKDLRGDLLYRKFGQIRPNPVHYKALVDGWERFTSELMQGFKCHWWDGGKGDVVIWYLRYRWVGEQPGKPIIHPFSLSRHKEILVSLDTELQEMKMALMEIDEAERKAHLQLRAGYEAELKRIELASQILQAANEKAQRYTDIVIFNGEIPAMMKASCNFPRFVRAHPYKDLHPDTDAPPAAEQTRYIAEFPRARRCIDQETGKTYISTSWYTIEWDDIAPVVKQSCCTIC